MGQSSEKKTKIDLPGQQKFKSLKDAFNHTEKVLGQLHVDRMKEAAKGKASLSKQQNKGL